MALVRVSDSAIQDERHDLGRADVRRRDLLVGQSFLGGNLSPLRSSLASEIILLKNDLQPPLSRFGCLRNDPLLGVDAVDNSWQIAVMRRYVHLSVLRVFLLTIGERLVTAVVEVRLSKERSSFGS